MAAPALIIVDDCDLSRVTYNPPFSWATLGSLSEYNRTTHAIDVGLGTIQFTFNGTSVGVYGTIAANTASTTITCTVDGVDIHVMDPVTPPQTLYHQLFCNGTVADDKQHTLEVTVYSNQQQQFFLDYITYEVPSTSTSNLAAVPAGATASLLVDGNSDQVAFNGNWSTAGTNGECHGTTTPNNYATFTFQGTQVAVFGTVSDSDLSNTWLSTYTIDDQQPGEPVNLSYLLQTSDKPLLSESKIQLYQTPVLQDGSHTLKVDFNSGNRPFWLDYFVYTPSPSLLPVTTQNPPQDLPSQLGPANTAGGSSLSPKQIIGITTGSVLALILLLASIIFAIRLKRSRRKYSRLSPDGMAESGLAGANRARPPAWGSSSTTPEASGPTVTAEPSYTSSPEVNGVGAVQPRAVSILPPPYTKR